MAACGAVALAAAALPLLTDNADAAPGEICLSGTLLYDFRSAEAGPSKPLRTKPVRNAGIEVWGREKASDKARRLSTATLRTKASNGRFRACHSPRRATSMNQMWLRFSAENTNLWKVRKKGGATVTWNTPVQRNLSRSKTLGKLKPDTAQFGAWHAFDTVNGLWRKRNNPRSNCWTARETDNRKCTTLTFNWAANAPRDASYGLNNTVDLAGDITDSEHVVVHEAAHFLQHKLFGGWWPKITNCDPHFVDKMSSDTCAWTEGFADAASAYVLGDYGFVGPDGDVTSFEHGPTYDDGDTVQGNVAGSLLDLWRNHDGGTWNRTIDVQRTHNVSVFREYFTSLRPAAGLPTTGGAAQALKKHTISY
ncbi:hypothetical protein GCM10012280_69660 [Wenjunlia tyrosinilytica]|uniref:Metalloprotease n=1 Tax=Wenjunlia tyrosinilytica TaxID=1544741 RepID=A0A917ZYD9_9ACTN|nr:hypothetical protein GCM10012280_69660 [Wenjunlia tyrosinilytica]